MLAPLMRRVAYVLVLAPLALALAACGSGTTTTPTPNTVIGAAPTTSTTPPSGGGGGGSGGVADGKTLFASQGCGACHTLKDAGASGSVGPNLDQVKPVAAIVVAQVTNGGGVMPAFKGKLTPQQIQDVAAYISSVAGK